MSFIADLKRRKVFRVAAAYIVAAWVVVQFVETVFPAFGLDDAAFRILVIALAIGLIPVVLLAWAFELTSRGIKLDSAGVDNEVTPAPRRRVSANIIAISVAVISLAVSGLMVMRAIQSHSQRSSVISQVMELVAQDEYMAAYRIAVDAGSLLEGDPVFENLWPEFTVQLSVRTNPEGAEVFIREYGSDKAEWTSLGHTPIESIRLPNDVLRWKFVKDGYEVAERAREMFNGSIEIELSGAVIPEGMIHIPQTSRFFLLTGYPGLITETPEFLIDRTEVTNREFKEFIDNGGYQNPEFWAGLPFNRDGIDVAPEEAIATFRDLTGRPGPSTWQGGNYADGEDNYPVRGVSWYEASAYARYKGGTLPTIYHWSTAAISPPFSEVGEYDTTYRGSSQFRSRLISASNFSSDGVAEVASYNAVGPYGTVDLAGNVREWALNPTSDLPGSDRYILGGSWKDSSYLFTYGIAVSPWERSGTNGFRVIRNMGDEEELVDFSRAVARPEQEVITPLSDQEFEIYRGTYEYDKTDLRSKFEFAEDSEHWRREVVSFDTAYGERMSMHIFLPKSAKPPYQVVTYYPSTDAIYASSSDSMQVAIVDFIVMSGRALAYPVLRGTYERNINLTTTWPENTRAYTDNVVKWIQDFRRSVDYLETRDDIDISRLGFFGVSWGGWNGPIVMALDDRFKAGVYVGGGIPPTRARPEASSASFAARVSDPVLMISGRHDMLRPVETYQAPMFESLATPAEHKRHAILEGGHIPPKNQLIRETLAWYDTYLGRVE
ncbi:MAG: SUMF1/EgtB/PvdO family nonheme iron enzyme [Xanthomonadales bacterium]|nr:SUMF1/EgtB/PvdO family nonheme iron enzyme [Xanthomonadales bacterium]MDH4021240.1 SUMF1/EgtB/PvdO family nonheme iron enzyme [Xanthomonadales bacterium]